MVCHCESTGFDVASNLRNKGKKQVGRSKARKPASKANTPSRPENFAAEVSDCTNKALLRAQIHH